MIQREFFSLGMNSLFYLKLNTGGGVIQNIETVVFYPFLLSKLGSSVLIAYKLIKKMNELKLHEAHKKPRIPRVFCTSPSGALTYEVTWTTQQKQSAEHRRDNIQNFADVWKCERPYHWLRLMTCSVWKTLSLADSFHLWFSSWRVRAVMPVTSVKLSYIFPCVRRSI